MAVKIRFFVTGRSQNAKKLDRTPKNMVVYINVLN